MKKFTALLFLLTLLFSINKVKAQNKFAVTLQGGFGSGAYEATHTGLGQGTFVFRAGVSYNILSILDGYIAYSNSGFSIDAKSTWLSKSVEYTSSGFSLGLRLKRPPGASVWIPWIRTGVVYQTLNPTRGVKNHSGLGFEIGLGLAYPINEQIKIVPSVNYMRYYTSENTINTSTVVVLNALVGIRYQF